MHSSRMRTVRSLSVSRSIRLGGVPLDTEPLGADPFPVNRMTHSCKNITLPQTSFASDKGQADKHTAVWPDN